MREEGDGSVSVVRSSLFKNKVMAIYLLVVGAWLALVVISTQLLFAVPYWGLTFTQSDAETGIVVERVQSNGPADLLGVKVGDNIVSFTRLDNGAVYTPSSTTLMSFRGQVRTYKAWREVMEEKRAF